MVAVQAVPSLPACHCAYGGDAIGQPTRRDAGCVAWPRPRGVENALARNADRSSPPTGLHAPRLRFAPTAPLLLLDQLTLADTWSVGRSPTQVLTQVLLLTPFPPATSSPSIPRTVYSGIGYVPTVGYADLEGTQRCTCGCSLRVETAAPAAVVVATVAAAVVASGGGERWRQKRWSPDDPLPLTTQREAERLVAALLVFLVWLPSW